VFTRWKARNTQRKKGADCSKGGDNKKKKKTPHETDSYLKPSLRMGQKSSIRKALATQRWRRVGNISMGKAFGGNGREKVCTLEVWKG